MTEAIFFDMDGLLIDSGPIWRNAYDEALSRRGLSFDQQQYLKTSGMRLKEAVEYWSGQGLYPASDCNQVYDEIHVHVMDEMSRCPYMPGAKQVLSYVQSLSIPIALVSASERMVVEHVIETKDWHEIFTVVVTGEDVTLPKPNPEAYMLAADGLGVGITACIVFEDSVPGVGAGIASGARTVAVPKHGVGDHVCMDEAWKRYNSLEDITKEEFDLLISA